MLAALSIRDIVLIDRLELSLDKGLCTLTGETGAGKSILLDSLGLAIGARADAGRTVVMAIHDIDLAFRFADDVVAVREGRIIAAGPTDEVMRDTTLSALYDVQVRIVRDEYGPTIRFLD
jgi:DNA repair ATPase RecN